MYPQLTLNNVRVRGDGLQEVKNLHITFDSPKACCPSVSMVDWFQDPKEDTKILDAQVSYIRWHRTMYTVLLSASMDPQQ